MKKGKIGEKKGKKFLKKEAFPLEKETFLKKPTFFSTICCPFAQKHVPSHKLQT